jgi:transcriptional regulator with XRE-family HTH domain
MSNLAVAEQSPPFPDLLRSWRKLRKLSQWDLSVTAGISQRHLSFLESGRSSPSREMVLKLAATLEVPLQEQNSLLSSAGFAPMFQAASLDHDSLALARQALEVMLKHHEPYPCLVVDRNWNMLMSNEANLRLFAQFIDPITVWSEIDDDGSASLVKLLLHPNGLKPFVRNWELFANYFLKGLRQELRANPYAIATRTLLEEISQLPDLPAIDITEVNAPVMPFLTMELVSPTLSINLFSMVSTFGSPHDVTLQQLKIETFFPADEESERAIRKLAAS